MASVNLAERMQKPAVCYTVFGETHSGVLHGVDNNFNAVLDKGGEQRELCFVRGETVLYIGFMDTDETSNDGSNGA
ncbi:U6 snRNA-associated Sm-like protein LSm6p [Trypanosoma rangeli SC58]|uniref:U6 snRNA-associated Sm-like protein LSm6p n=1 Tax=Trypanosoma rangeli SC58 TaxID=429131 RepID=A0A061J0R5_TRYRA|nr:U6 snRNA-associated Sm-like protein LSm6p [Trypanosoma rangeli SC58]